MRSESSDGPQHVDGRVFPRQLERVMPTVELSGVVMAMMAFLATVIPRLNICCFFWLFIAYISGAAIGIAAELVYRMRHSEFLQALQCEI